MLYHARNYSGNISCTCMVSSTATYVYYMSNGKQKAYVKNGGVQSET